MTLKDLKVGTTCKVKKIHGEGPVKRRIMDMGITKGVEFYVRKVAPLGDPMELNLRGAPTATVLPLWGFQNPHEGEYLVSAADSLPEGRLFDLPATFAFSDGTVLSVTEAAMSDYPGMLLLRKDGRLGGCLSPRLDRPELCVAAALPHRSPWRVFMVSDDVGDLISSTILTSLADPCRIEDTSWLKPGKTTFPWWCDSACADSTFQWGNNFRTNAYFVDFAAASGLPLIFKPNAGLPVKGPDGRTTHPYTAETFAAESAPALETAAYVGACCGSDAGYIRALKELL